MTRNIKSSNLIAAANKINWWKHVYVKKAPLKVDAIGQRISRTAKLLDGRYSIKGQNYLYINGDVYYPEQMIRAYVRLVRNNLRRLPAILDKIYIISRRFSEKESRFDDKILENKSNKELAKILKKYQAAYENVFTTLVIVFAVEEVLSGLLKKYIGQKFSEKIEEYFIALSSTFEDNQIVHYRQNLLKLAVASRSLSRLQLNTKLERLAKDYGYLGIKFYLGKPYTLDSVKKQFAELLSQNPKKQLEHGIQIKRSARKKYRRALSDLRPDGTNKTYIELLRKTIYLRMYRLEGISQGELNSFVLLNEIGKRIGVNGFNLVYFQFSEIESALLTNFRITKKEILKRKKPYAMITMNNSVRFYFDNDYLQFKRKFKLRNLSPTEIKGQTSYAGFVIGKVRIIRESKDVSKLNKGEILVTRMTGPDYIFAMQKAAAIITDIGGVTSHASVISRELGKPCITGTISATKLLKTGDLIEVDADKGIVRILKK